MPILYVHPHDDEPAGSLFGAPEDGNDWQAIHSPIVGRIALAALTASIGTAAIALAEGNGHQDDPAGNLHGQYEEDFYRIPTAPVIWLNLLPQYHTFDQQETSTHIEDDYFLNPVAPIQSTNRWMQPWVGDEQELSPKIEDDYWLRTILPVQQTYLRQDWIYGEQGEVHITVDEDYQLSPLPLWTFTALHYQPSEDDFSASVVTANPEEEYWINPVAPVPASMIYGLTFFMERDDYPVLSAPPVISTGDTNLYLGYVNLHLPSNMTIGE